MNIEERFTACLLGGAIGDALGYPVEFMSLNQIKATFGANGITAFVPEKSNGKALISDDTQMTLFTADGILWADEIAAEPGTDDFTNIIWQSYLRWYYTQTGRITDNGMIERKPHEAGKQKAILDMKELFAARAPGTTCTSALRSGKMGSMEKPLNSSEGCGGVMRVAPVGLFLYKRPELAFKTGCDVAAITHGHPSGCLSAGFLAAVVAELINEKSLIVSVNSAKIILKAYQQYEETMDAVDRALKLSGSNVPPETAITTLGKGWVGEEALAIALYCALKERDFKKALIMAVNHGGDSDSTGAICGNIMGAHLGLDSIPAEWAENVELGDFIRGMAERLFQQAER